MVDRDQNTRLTTGSDQVTVQAASWVAQLDGGRLSHADRIALAEWAGRSPRHLQRLRHLSELWGQVDDTLNLALEYSPAPSKVSLHSVFSLWLQSMSLRSRSLVYISVSGSACAFAICCAWLLAFLQFSPVQEIYRTEIGEYKTFVFADGSKVTLNTNSILEFTIDRRNRSVTLHQGEAIFEVEKDPNKPFRVYAGASVVEAVGTAFVVELSGQNVDVTVTEGIVAFAANTHGLDSRAVLDDALAVLVEAGHAVSSALHEHQRPTKEKVTPSTIIKRTAWRNGILIFDQDPLSYVVAEVGRYLPQTVVISDPTLSNLEFSGVFKSGELETLLSTLESSFDIERSVVQPDLIHLKKANALPSSGPH